MGTIAACAPIAFGFTQVTEIEVVYADRCRGWWRYVW